MSLMPYVGQHFWTGSLKSSDHQS